MPRKKSHPSKSEKYDTIEFHGTIIMFMNRKKVSDHIYSKLVKNNSVEKSKSIEHSSQFNIIERCAIDAILNYGKPCTFKKIFDHCEEYFIREGLNTEHLKSNLKFCLKNDELFNFLESDPTGWYINETALFQELKKDKHQKPEKNKVLGGEVNHQLEVTSFPKKRKLIFSGDDIPLEELIKRVNESKLTNLQILISIPILQSPKAEADLETILNFVYSHQSQFLGKDSTLKTTDPKRAILASLSKNASTNPLFMKGNEENTWAIGPSNVLYGISTLPDEFFGSILQTRCQNDIIELTELQKMIMRAISFEKGRPCPLQKICDYVNPKYENLKRRDGSSYATNAKRAIQASLSNNSSNRPIFQPTNGPNEDEMYWTLTERGERHLDLIEDEY